MPKKARGSSVLFWLMALAGGGTLAACLILPAWLDYQAALGAVASARQLIADRTALSERYQKQIDHLKHDPSYVERLALEEFGLATPGATAIPITSPDDSAAAPTAAVPYSEFRTPEDDVLPEEVSEFLERTLVRYPLARVFVMERTRPAMMALGGLLLASAVLLLGRPRHASPQHDPSPPSTRALEREP